MIGQYPRGRDSERWPRRCLAIAHDRVKQGKPTQGAPVNPCTESQPQTPVPGSPTAPSPFPNVCAR